MKQILTMDVEKNIENALDFAIKLKNKGIKGEFYITGGITEKYTKEIKIIAKNHVIGGHGYNHERFEKLTIKEQEEIIKKTIDIFNKNNIKIQGWRFPYLSFNKDSLKLIRRYNLYDSSINRRRILGRLYFKKGFHLLPKGLIERPWDYVDLHDKNILNKSGRLILHDYNYDKKKKKRKNEYVKKKI